MTTSDDCPQPSLFETESGSTPYVEGFLVRTYLALALKLELPAPEVAYGASTLVLLANFNRDTSSWKTLQPSFLEDYPEFSATWPRSGMMRSGTAYQLPTLELGTDAPECGLLPTPTATANQGAPSMTKHAGVRRMRNLPTPNAGSSHSRFTWQELGGAGNAHRGTEFGRMKIHPWEWEWMMGFPKDWTA